MINQQDYISKAASLLKSIGHPIRVQIIIALSQNTSMTVTDMIYYLSIDQPVISLHLAVLRKNNVIKVKKDGKKSLYSIKDKSVKQIINIAYYTREK
tara:strand:- start:238 stop:528 length:291 start_codon:yes stop_codon:yes gene_type:complete